MATMYAGGGRRSVAPEYSPRAVLGMAVIPQQQFTQQVLSSFTAPTLTTSLGPSSGSFWQGGGSTDASNSVTGGGTQGLNQMGALAGVLGSLGAINQDAGLAGAGKGLGQAVSAIGLGSQLGQAQSMTDVGKAFAGNPAVMSALGVPGLAAGALAGSVKGGVEGAVTGLGKGLAYGAVPGWAALDAGLSLVGAKTTMDMLIGAFTGGGMPATESGDVNGGVEAGGVTVGGPMSSGDIAGTDIGAPTGEFGGGFGDFGGFGGFGGDYGGGFGGTAGSGNDGGDNGAGDGGDSGGSGDSGW